MTWMKAANAKTAAQTWTVNDVKRKKIVKTAICALVITCCMVTLSGCSVKDKFAETAEKVTSGISDFANNLTDTILGVLDE